MKYLLTYNESFSDGNKLQSLLQKFGESIDTKKLFEVLEPYKDKLRKVATKYTIDGKIDVGLIEQNIKKIGFFRKTEEWDWEATKEYGEKMGGSFSGGGSSEKY